MAEVGSEAAVVSAVSVGPASVEGAGSAEGAGVAGDIAGVDPTDITSDAGEQSGVGVPGASCRDPRNKRHSPKQMRV